MCMKKCFLNFGEKVFNVLVLLGLIAGVASGIITGVAVGGKQGILAGALQLILSWGCTLIISLIVYSLLDIRRLLDCKPCHTKDEGCGHHHSHTNA